MYYYFGKPVEELTEAQLWLFLSLKEAIKVSEERPNEIPIIRNK